MDYSLLQGLQKLKQETNVRTASICVYDGRQFEKFNPDDSHNSLARGARNPIDAETATHCKQAVNNGTVVSIQTADTSSLGRELRKGETLFKHYGLSRSSLNRDRINAVIIGTEIIAAGQSVTNSSEAWQRKIETCLEPEISEFLASDLANVTPWILIEWSQLIEAIHPMGGSPQDTDKRWQSWLRLLESPMTPKLQKGMKWTLDETSVSGRIETHGVVIESPVGRLKRKVSLLVSDLPDGRISVSNSLVVLPQPCIANNVEEACQQWRKQFASVLSKLIRKAVDEPLDSPVHRVWRRIASLLDLEPNAALYRPLPEGNYQEHSLLMKRQYTGELLEVTPDRVVVRWNGDSDTQQLTASNADLSGFQSLNPDQWIVANRTQRTDNYEFVWTSDPESMAFDPDELPKGEEANQLIEEFVRNSSILNGVNSEPE
jgi:hypothetical protein